MTECLFKASGKVIHGFGRGSRELGIPTGNLLDMLSIYKQSANLDDEVIRCVPESMEAGVYAGFAQVNNGPVCKMVMSLGWNPFYKNEKKSLVIIFTHFIFHENIKALNINISQS